MKVFGCLVQNVVLSGVVLVVVWISKDLWSYLLYFYLDVYVVVNVFEL